MHDLKLFENNEDQIDLLMQTLQWLIISEDIGMKFGLKKCSLLLMKRAGKKIRFECITLLDGRIMGEISEGGCKKQKGDEKKCKRVKKEAETSIEIKIEWKE